MLCSMAVMAREAWTDERLDDLKENVNQRFDQVDKRFDQVDARFNRLEARFDAMQRTIIIGFVSTIGSVVVSVLGGILVTQL
jgi:hypothetical protein